MDAVSSFNKSDLLPLSVGKAMIWLIPQHSYRVLRRYRHPEGMIPFHGHALLPNGASSNPKRFDPGGHICTENSRLPAACESQTDWSKGLVPHGTDRNPAGRSQPASIGDHWLCPWYSAPSFSSAARIVTTRLSRILTI